MLKFEINKQIPFKTIQNYGIFFKVKTIGVSYNKHFKNSKDIEVFQENDEYLENLELYSNVLFHWHIFFNDDNLRNDYEVNLNFFRYFNKLLLYEGNYKFDQNVLNFFYDNKNILSYFFLENTTKFLYYSKKNNYLLGHFFFYDSTMKLLIFYFFNLNKFVKLDSQKFLLFQKSNVYKILKKNKLWFFFKNEKCIKNLKKIVAKLYKKRYTKNKFSTFFIFNKKLSDLANAKLKYFEPQETNNDDIKTKNTDKKKLKEKFFDELDILSGLTVDKKKRRKFLYKKFGRLYRKTLKQHQIIKKMKNRYINKKYNVSNSYKKHYRLHLNFEEGFPDKYIIQVFQNKNSFKFKRKFTTKLKEKVKFIKKFIVLRNLHFINKKYKLECFKPFVKKKQANIFVIKQKKLKRKKLWKNSIYVFGSSKLKQSLNKLNKRITFLSNQNLEFDLENFYTKSIVNTKLLQFRQLTSLRNYADFFIQLDRDEQESDLLQFYFKPNFMQKALKSNNVRFLNFVFNMKSRIKLLRKLTLLKKIEREKNKPKTIKKVINKNFLYNNYSSCNKELKLFDNLFENMEEDDFIQLIINQNKIKSIFFFNPLKLKYLKFNQFLIQF